MIDYKQPLELPNALNLGEKLYPANAIVQKTEAQLYSSTK